MYLLLLKRLEICSELADSKAAVFGLFHYLRIDHMSCSLADCRTADVAAIFASIFACEVIT